MPAKYAVLISAGFPIDYSRKQGWDGLHDTPNEALALAERAERNPGWSAKVIRLSETEAAQWDETIDQRLKRERAELHASYRAAIRYR